VKKDFTPEGALPFIERAKRATVQQRELTPKKKGGLVLREIECL
jgi:hypothetical protein